MATYDWNLNIPDNYMAKLRAKAKRCLNCKVPMIGTSSTDRQKYCSPECRKEAYKQKRRIGWKMPK